MFYYVSGRAFTGASSEKWIEMNLTQVVINHYLSVRTKLVPKIHVISHTPVASKDSYANNDQDDA